MSGKARDINAYLGAGGSIVNTALTAAGGGDNTAVNGATIDRFALGSRFLSAVACVSARATMASGETMTTAIKFQDSANDSDWVDYGTALAATVIVTAVGGAAVVKPGHLRLGVDLSKARRYVRQVVTPDLSRAGTDTATIAAVVILGGGEVGPTTQPA